MHSSFFNICYIKFCLRGHTTPTNVRGHKQILVRPSTTKYECTFVFFSFIYFSFSSFLLNWFHFFLICQIWRCGQPKADFTSANTNFGLSNTSQLTFLLLFIVPEKAFLHIPVTNWNLFLFAGEYISVHSSKEPPIIELENTG